MSSASSEAVEDLAHLLARVATVRRALGWDGEVGALPDLHEAAAILQRQQPIDPAGAAVSQDALDSLLAWAQGRGARLADGLRLVAGEHGTRVETTTPIAAGEALVQVPASCLLLGSAVRARHPLLAPWLAGEVPFGPATLMLWLFAERYAPSKDDPWAPYVEALPTRAPASALTWPRSPGEHLSAAAEGRRFLAGVLQLYCMFHRRLQDTAEDERPWALEAFTLQRWLWAGGIMASRQNLVDDELALVPLWDLLDHDESLGASTTQLTDGALRCVAAVDYAAGERVGMYYGARTPTQHWVYGGFVPAGPPDGARAALPFSLPAAATMRRPKIIWLVAQHDHPLEVEVARGDLQAAQRRARWFALDQDELDRLGVSSVADAWELDSPLSEAGEARASRLLREWLLERAGPPGAWHDAFSHEHARLLAANYAYTAGLQPRSIGDVQLRLLDDSDAPVVDAFVADHAATSRLLRNNLHAAGLIDSGAQHSGSWIGAFDGEVLLGVAMHARTGHLLLQAPRLAAELARELLTWTGRDLAGLAGPQDQVDAVGAGLGLQERPRTHESKQEVWAMPLTNLTSAAPPPGLDVRRATTDDVASMQAARAFEEGARDALVMRVEAGQQYLGQAGGKVVSMAACRRDAPDGATISHVWTSPAARGRGYARSVLAFALRQAAQTGATQAALSLDDSSDPAADTCYRALGFEPVGVEAVMLFEAVRDGESDGAGDPHAEHDPATAGRLG